VALYPDDGADWDRFFSAADRRLYAAKAGGRNGTVGKDAEEHQGAT
jgi:GGDEF domain-containing protein